MSRLTGKLIVIVVAAIAGTLYVAIPRTVTFATGNNEIIATILLYRSWTKVNEGPIEVVTSSPLGKKPGISYDIEKTPAEGG